MADQGRRSLDVRADAAADPAERSRPSRRAKLRSTARLRRACSTIDPVTGTPRFVGKLDGFLTAPSSASPQDVALGYARRQRGRARPHRSDLERPAPHPRLHRHLRDHAPDLGAVGRRGGGVRERPLRERRQGRAADQPDGLAGRRPRARSAASTPSSRPAARSRPRSTTPAPSGRCPRCAAASGADQRDRVRRRRHRPARPVHRRGRQHPARLAGDREGLLDRDLRVRARRDHGRGAAAPEHGRLRGRQRLGVRAEHRPRSAPSARRRRDPVAAHVPGRLGHAGRPSCRATTPTSTPTSTTTTRPTRRSATAPSAARSRPSSRRATGTTRSSAEPEPGRSELQLLHDLPAVLVVGRATARASASAGATTCARTRRRSTTTSTTSTTGSNGAPFGFTAAAGNFEGTDAVNAEILDGADTRDVAGAIPGTPDLDHINNANMNTPADGTPPRMQMYLFADLSGSSMPESNGGDDASVIYHEYTHGLSNRLVLDSAGNPALRAFQSRAMGEGWSDWYAMDYLEGHDLDETDTADNGEMNIGVYVMGGDIHNLRTEGLDCNRGTADADCPGAGNAGSGGYTLGDMGKILCDGFTCEPEFHADGEIWAQTLWDLRQRFVADLGGDTLNGTGVTRARNVITRGMELAPPDPSFLEMRNAIIQADKVVYGGADKARLWAVFAKRGMGYFASDKGATDTVRARTSRSRRTATGRRAGRSPASCARPRAAPRSPTRWSRSRAPATWWRPPTPTAATRSARSRRTPTRSVDRLGARPPARRRSPTSRSTAATQTRDFNLHRDWADFATGAPGDPASPPDFTLVRLRAVAARSTSRSPRAGAARPSTRTTRRTPAGRSRRPSSCRSRSTSAPSPSIRARPAATTTAPRRAGCGSQTARATGAFTTVGHVQLHPREEPQAEQRGPGHRQDQRPPGQDHDARHSGRRPGGRQLHGPVGVPGLRHAVATPWSRAGVRSPARAPARRASRRGPRT